jgi:hypothetical protein
MVAEPAVTPVTRPVEALIVATAGSLLFQEPPVTDELNDVVPDAQIDWFPLKVPAETGVVTVRVPEVVPVPPVHPDSVTV